MVNSIDQRLLDINAVALGGGVGLAALEAMFNLVQTQSSLGAGMVKNLDTGQNCAVLALAQALEGLLESDQKKVASSPSGPQSNLDELLAALKNQTVSTSASAQMENASPGSMDQHLSELLALLREHLSEILKNSKATLAVT